MEHPGSEPSKKIPADLGSGDELEQVTVEVVSGEEENNDLTETFTRIDADKNVESEEINIEADMTYQPGREDQGDLEIGNEDGIENANECGEMDALHEDTNKEDAEEEAGEEAMVKEKETEVEKEDDIKEFIIKLMENAIESAIENQTAVAENVEKNDNEQVEMGSQPEAECEDDIKEFITKLIENAIESAIENQIAVEENIEKDEEKQVEMEMEPEVILLYKRPKEEKKGKAVLSKTVQRRNDLAYQKFIYRNQEANFKKYA